MARRVARSLIVPVLLVLLWAYVTSGASLVSPALLPAPERVVSSAFQLVSSGELFRNAGASLARIFVAVGVALAVGVPLGLAIGLFKPVEELLDGLLSVVRPIPPFAWIPLVILWFGIGDAPVIFITTLAAFFAVLLNTIAGVKSVDRVLVRAALSLGSDNWGLVRRVILPASLPSIFTGFRVAIGLAWMSIVAAELVAASSGLGYMITFYREVLRSDVIIVGMLAIGLIGLGMDRATRRLERWLLPWRQELRAK